MPLKRDFLKIGNPHKVIAGLSDLFPEDQIELIREQQRLQAKAMFDLGVSHFRFAKSLGSSRWRQRVSRFYYGVYNVSKAIRYVENGVHSTDSSDHKKVGELPANFQNRETYSTRLKELRDDRNKCDYDHSINAGDLFISQTDAQLLAENFLKDAVIYLRLHGLDLRRRM